MLGGPPIVIPLTNEIELEGIESAEGILKIKDMLMNSISVSKKGDGFYISSSSVEKYYGEDCDVSYEARYVFDGDKRIASVDKFFNPVTTSEKGISYSISINKMNGQLMSVEESKNGYLEDSDNYYYVSTKDTEDGSVHVICGRSKNQNGEYDISYVEKRRDAHAYGDSIARKLYEKGLSTQSSEGKQVLSEFIKMRSEEAELAKEI